MPTSVKVVRILLFIAAGITALSIIVFLTLSDRARVGLMEPVSAESLGRMSAYWLPGIARLWLAFRTSKGRVSTRRWIMGVEIYVILQALGRLGQGDPRGLSNLILPTVVLILVTRPAARHFFRGKRQNTSIPGAMPGPASNQEG